MERFDMKKWLTDRRMTVRELATRLGVNFSTINRWRNGERKTPAYIQRLLDGVDRDIRREGRNPETVNSIQIIEEIRATRKRLSELVAARDKSLPRAHNCGYRKCGKPLSGRRDKKFCCDSCRTMECLERKIERKAEKASEL